MGTDIVLKASVLTGKGSLQAGQVIQRSNCGMSRQENASGH